MQDKEQLHSYILLSYNSNSFFGNIGDHIQTIATKYAISQIDEQADFDWVQRDRLAFENKPQQAICVMQGWFEHPEKGLNFLPGPSVIPVWLGTHWHPYTRVQLGSNPDRLRNMVEVGCRDKATLEFCKKQRIPAYFSRCLALTFPRRDAEPKSQKIFVVTTPEYVNAFRSSLSQKNITFIQQQKLPLGTEPRFYDKVAEGLLKLYHDEAGLVITTALHCALPCIAMGIPTVFIYPPNLFDPDRFTGMEDIIPVWTFDDLRKKSFPYKAPNIEPLKALMIENLDLSIRKAQGIPVDEDHLRDVRQKIENFSATL